MIFELNVINVLIAAIAAINTLYGLVVFSRNRKNTTNQSFFFLTLAVSSWGVAMLFLRSMHNPTEGIWAARWLYATAALIPFASVYFASIFPEKNTRLSSFQKFVIPIPLLFILLLTFLPQNGLIYGISLAAEHPVILFNIIQHTIYVAFIISYFAWVYVILFRKFFGAHSTVKVQLAYVLAGTLTTTGIAVFTNLLLPYFGIFSLNWFGQIGILAMITFILYSILKHHLFSINVIATEVFVATLQLTLFTQIFVAQGLQERLFAIGVFSASTIAGFLLIRNVIREVEQRQEIERLAKDLQKANTRLKELDAMKSQFLSIASHDLRAPLTAIRNFMSLLLDGTYGVIPPAAKEGMQQVFDRATEMADSVSDYLNVSRIEQGRMKYDFVESNLYDVISDSVAIFRSNFEKKGLTLNISLPEDKTFPVKADVGKLQEVFNNLLDNAAKYTPQGTVTVSLEKIADNKARVTLQDTGVGMDQKTIRSLFKLFSTGENSRKINTSSTGIGLYITKKHVEAHGGRVWAESDGEGKGSRFIVELPLKA
ncbi:MAG: ATP-binding protein [Patescibacteria group bacterium UBA2163]